MTGFFWFCVTKGDISRYIGGNDLMLDWIKTKVRNLAQLPERKLIEKIKEGDTEAFETLYLTYLDQIYRYVFFRVNQEKHLAEDITETAFMKAWQHIQEFNTEAGTFKSWIYQITRTTIIDSYRTQKPTTPLDHASDVQTDENLEDTVFKKDQYEQILNSLHLLSDEQREVVTLRFIDDLSYAEIAKLLEKNEDAIRALNYRGLQILRKELS